MSEEKEVKSYVPSIVDSHGMVTFGTSEQVFKVAQELIKLGAVPKRFDTTAKLTGPLFFLAQTKRPYAFLRLIADIQGSMTIFAEGLPALAQTDPLYGEVREYWVDREGKKVGPENPSGEAYAAVCSLKRRDSQEWNTYMFTMDDAKKAGLNSQVWQKYPKDMLMHKARARAYKAIYPNALLGLDVYEDRMDYEQPRDVSEGLKTLRGIGSEEIPSEDKENC